MTADLIPLNPYCVLTLHCIERGYSDECEKRISAAYR